MSGTWRTLAVLAALALPAGLGGCGFTPLYAEQGAAAGLTHIDVVAPDGRVGYLLREDLNDDLGLTKGDKPVYRLEMTFDQTRQAHGITANATAQRYELDLKVSYTLTDLATGQVAHKGEVVSFVSYDSAEQPYAGIAARQDTQNRLASDAAQKIQTELAAWMASRPPG
jgi:LPS-assembly lipoprotein